MPKVAQVVVAGWAGELGVECRRLLDSVPRCFWIGMER